MFAYPDTMIGLKSQRKADSITSQTGSKVMQPQPRTDYQLEGCVRHILHCPVHKFMRCSVFWKSEKEFAGLSQINEERQCRHYMFLVQDRMVGVNAISRDSPGGKALRGWDNDRYCVLSLFLWKGGARCLPPKRNLVMITINLWLRMPKYTNMAPGRTGLPTRLNRWGNFVFIFLVFNPG